MKKNLKELLLLLPNVALLIGRLLIDPRVSITTKMLLGGAALYLASPIDLLPDFIPLVGYLDDLVVVAVVLDGLFTSVEREILFAHWPGEPDTLERAVRTAGKISVFVPKRLKAKIFSSKGANR